MPSSGKRTIFLLGDKDGTEPKKIVLEDNGRPKKIVFEEKGRVKRIILEGDDDPEHPRQTVIIRENDEKPKLKKGTILVIAVAAIPALIGAGVFGWYNRPRDPTLEIKSITLSGFSMHTSTKSMLLATIDIDTTIYAMVRNPNITPICFHATIMEIFTEGVFWDKLWLSGLEATHHLKDLFHDVTKREMVLHAKATVKGDIKVWKYRHHYEVYVRSEIKVDPFFLDVIDQRHRADINIRGVAVPGLLDK